MGLNSKNSRIFNIATRGSALALVQSRHIQSECQRLFPDHSFELKIMKTTGDHLQKATEAEANAPETESCTHPIIGLESFAPTI